MYIDDNEGKLPFAYATNGSPMGPYAWLTGILDYSANPQHGYINANLANSPSWTYG